MDWQDGLKFGTGCAWVLIVAATRYYLMTTQKYGGNI